MIAHYGYQDAEGAFFITIDSEPCGRCGAKPCIAACPRGLFCEEEDPYGESVVVIDAHRRRELKHQCWACKTGRDRPVLPCVGACPFRAVTHSW